MNQKLESNTLKLVANNAGYQVKGDVKINGQPASLDYRKANEGDADIRLQATLDDASRARLGIDLGPAVSGSIPIKVIGKIGENDSRVGIEADLTSLRLDNILPGWVKVPGKSGKATFIVVKKEQSTLFQDIVVEGGGVSIKGSLEVDQNGDLLNANFPTYAPSDGDKTSLKAERGADGVVKVMMRGDVFDGRGFLKSAISGKEADPKSKSRNIDLDIDVKLGAVAGFNGEALRSVDSKFSRRNGIVKNFTLTGKVGRDTPVTADLRGRGQGQGRDVIMLQTNDAGAFFRFTDMYSKVIGGQLVACAGAADGRTQRQGRPDQRPRLLHQGRGFARPCRRRRFYRHSERRFLFGIARRVHPAERTAHDPRWCREGTDDRCDHRRQHRYRRQSGSDERHLRSDVWTEQHVRPDSGARPVPRQRQQ